MNKKGKVVWLMKLCRIVYICWLLSLGGCATVDDPVSEDTEKNSSLDTTSETGDSQDSESATTDSDTEIQPVLEPIDFDEALPVVDDLTPKTLVGTYQLSTGGIRITFEASGHFYSEMYDDDHSKMWESYEDNEENQWSLEGRQLTLQFHRLLMCIDCSKIIETYTSVVALVDETLYWDVWRRMTDDGGVISGTWATASTSNRILCLISLSIADSQYDLTYQPFDVAANGLHARLPLTHHDVIEIDNEKPLWVPPVEILDAMEPNNLYATTIAPTTEDGRRYLSFPTDNIMTWERTLTYTRVQQ